MNFRFRKQLGEYALTPVTLLLKTEDPLLFRIGGLRDYPDVDEAELNRLLRETVDRELGLAHRIMGMWDTDEYRDRKENILEELRIEARELFTEMGESLDNAGEFSRLNDGFSDVIRRKRDIEMAFSKRNPWLGYYRDLEWKDRKRVLAKGVAGIIVHATILDTDWFSHPAYPIVGKGCMRLKGALAVPEAGDMADEGHSKAWTDRGWCRACVPEAAGDSDVVSYVEPKLKILSYEPIIPFSEIRNLLPAEWLKWPV